MSLDVAQRVAIGKAARRRCRARATPSGRRSTRAPIPVELLRSQEVARVAELVDLRHERMLESPFAFYRGAAIVMASDLATTPDSGLRVQCCGDAHLANFGGFASPDARSCSTSTTSTRRIPGPFEWDVKRLAASFEIAARSREFSAKTARELVLESRARRTGRPWRSSPTATNLDVWYARLDVDAILRALGQRGRAASSVKRFEAMVTKAQSKDSTKALTKLARKVDGEFRIVSDPPLVVPIDELAHEEHVELDPAQLRAWLHERFRRLPAQPASRIAATCSRATGSSTSPARSSASAASARGAGSRCCWAGTTTIRCSSRSRRRRRRCSSRTPGKSGFANHGQRVVEGQRLLQASSDILLGWATRPGLDGVERDFYIRQLWDWKVSADLETMTPEVMKVYAQICGWTLARGHARSGDRVAIAAYLGSGGVFDEAIADFAAAYADQNQRDHGASTAPRPSDATNGGAR